jgi:hypothetical protein
MDDTIVDEESIKGLPDGFSCMICARDAARVSKSEKIENLVTRKHYADV